MTVKILDVSIPLFGAIIFWLLYAEILPLKKNRDGHKRLYEKARNIKTQIAGCIVMRRDCIGTLS